MESQSFDLLSNNEHNASLDFSTFDSTSVINERSKEIVDQLIHSLFDACFFDLPRIPYDQITKTTEDLSRYLTLNNYPQDSKFSEFILQSLRLSVRNYDFKSSLSKSLQKHWTHISSDLDPSRSPDPSSKLEDTISQFYSMFAKLLYSLNESFSTSLLKITLFPSVSAFDDLFKAIAQELKDLAVTRKLNLRLSPGVDPPQVKYVNRQVTKVIKKPYTEWNTFSNQQVVDVDMEPSCVMLPLFHRLMSYTTQARLHVVSYFAPSGWDVTRVTATVVDGNHKTAVIRRTACRQNKALVEVEIGFPRITREHIWCKVQMEGVLSRKCVQEIKRAEVKTVVVTVDEDGEHELPEDVVEEIESS
jgi:hypothetical protein